MPRREINFSKKANPRRRGPPRPDAPRGSAEIWEMFLEGWDSIGEVDDVTLREARALMVEPEQVVVWRPKGAPVVVAANAVDLASFQARGAA